MWWLAAALAADPIRVYPYETPLRAWVEPRLWTAATADEAYHSVEVEYGLTDHVSLAGYLDLATTGAAPLRYDGLEAELRWRWFEKRERLVDAAIVAEAKLPRDGPGEVGARLVLERDLGDFRVDLNPELALRLRAPAGLGLAAGVYWRRFYALQPGIELYADFGPLRRPLPFAAQDDAAGPVLFLRFARTWSAAIRGLFGLTPATDDVQIAATLGFELPTIRPSAQQR